jgi:ATP-dependent 26S proteasome regulatory subunit
MIKEYLNAGYPALYVITQEPRRAELDMARENLDGINLSWDCIDGIKTTIQGEEVSDSNDPLEMLKWLTERSETVLFAHNLHLFIPNNPEIIQMLQNGAERWKASGNCLILIAPNLAIVPEVEKIFHVIDFPLPTVEQLNDIQKRIVTPLDREANIESSAAAKGLTAFEAETAFAYSLATKGQVIPEVITNTKAQMIKKSGCMEFSEPAGMENLGGLEQLKTYIRNRMAAFNPESDLPIPKGIILCGVPGTGKSLSAKVIASALRQPLIRFDISACKGSLVGESERKAREAVKTIDAFGDCVVMVDEVEKAIGGSGLSGTGDTTESITGILLTWMQERTSQSYIVATANDVTKLKSEFIRRFDAVFFVDMPNEEERKEIIGIMAQRYRWNPSEIDVNELSRKTNGYTGSELETLLKEAKFDGIEEAFNNLVPISVSMSENIDSLRKWAKTHARMANTKLQQTFQEQRKIKIL